MPKKHQTFYAAICLVLSVVSGIAGASYYVGAGQQKMNDAINTNSIKVATIKTEINQELDRFTELIVLQITQLQNATAQLNNSATSLHTEVQVLKVLVSGLEKERSN
ncbi:hypothetical protein LCGC14_0141670 [marine sediment metagenome]|uniref:Uncharacterized protein n=1 Tax=marine sediment metagenome TaxID=412755 RepID=A0A0F9VGG7_9ZZZZ